MDDPLVLAGETFASRLILGTGGASSMGALEAAVKASGAEIVTVALRRLDPNARGSFGGPDHGEGVTALHLAAQAGRPETVDLLLAAGADRTTRDELHDGTPSDWASFGGHAELAEVLRLSA